VPQSAAAAFNPAHRIIDQVIEVAAIHALMPATRPRARQGELFRALALPGPETIGQRYPHQVSGGQLQRLMAAMALIGGPKLVIFDEPTTALDVTTQIEVLRAFKAAMKATGASGVYVSHDLAVVAQIADRIVVLKNGEVQEIGATRALLEAPQHPYTRELLAAFRPRTRVVAAAQAAARPAPVLEVTGLEAGYGPRGADGRPSVLAVKGVDLTLMPGRNLGIIGESGCGKSTLARAVAGALARSAGRVLLDGQELAPRAADRTRDQLRSLQMVFQSADTALNPARSVRDILARPIRFYFGLGGAEVEARVDRLLDMTRLPRALKHRRPVELSGGQKQRVNLARALAAEPRLILCDEITSALDSVVGAAIVELLKELQKELSVSFLFISHDLQTVRAICDEVAVMYAGEKVEQTTPDRVGAPGGHPYARLLMSSVPKLDPDWLDTLERDPALVEAFSKR
jgi:peptide/nickel transport system ATP-binding protein